MEFVPLASRTEAKEEVLEVQPAAAAAITMRRNALASWKIISLGGRFGAKDSLAGTGVVGRVNSQLVVIARLPQRKQKQAKPQRLAANLAIHSD